MSELERFCTVLYGFVRFPTVSYDCLRLFFFSIRVDIHTALVIIFYLQFMTLSQNKSCPSGNEKYAKSCQTCVKTVPKLGQTVPNHTHFRHLARLWHSFFTQFLLVMAQFHIILAPFHTISAQFDTKLAQFDTILA